ncbi:hypothetical protein BT93_A0595 [Corymbia citriodora subsp. variegata]|nr:hypothetical protein BT93_A0595 [Corymbia citriodora subsp. variegata]
MATSPSLSPSPSSRSGTLLSKLLRVSILILLLVNSCSAARARHLGMAAPASRVALSLDRPRRQEGVTSFRHRGRVFNFFPRGSTVPPSGPSKRHNDETDSQPHD